ncbi:inducible alternative oxidase 2 [Rhizina undulata]
MSSTTLLSNPVLTTTVVHRLLYTAATTRAASTVSASLLAHKPLKKKTVVKSKQEFSTGNGPFFTAALQTPPRGKELVNAEHFFEPAWPHPIYTEKQMKDIVIAHRQTKCWHDYVALSAVRLLRWGFDVATGYRHDKEIAAGTKEPSKQAFAMTTHKWLTRFIFLESIAGVPGMVAGSIRHLHSLRKLRRDHGWIETLLEEAYNERLHLLSFLALRRPSWFMRISILGAQGVFYNAFFFAYLISPKICHRFVGYLEEEAVITYSRAIADIDNGKLPEWETLQAPEIAVQYWKMKEGATMRDLLMYVRADEAKHREVNHTLANMEQDEDPNPFKAKYEEGKPHPSKGHEWSKPTGWERHEVMKRL